MILWLNLLFKSNHFQNHKFLECHSLIIYFILWSLCELFLYYVNVEALYKLKPSFVLFIFQSYVCVKFLSNSLKEFYHLIPLKYILLFNRVFIFYGLLKLIQYFHVFQIFPIFKLRRTNILTSFSKLNLLYELWHIIFLRA